MVRGTICFTVICMFAASASAQTTVTIEDLPQFEWVTAINNNGLIAGEANGRAVIAKPGEPATVIDGGLGSFPFSTAINDGGQVVGHYRVIQTWGPLPC